MSNDRNTMTTEDWEDDTKVAVAPSIPTQKADDDWFGSRPVTNRQLWDSAAPILAPSPQHGSIPTNQIKILRRDPTAGQKKSPGPTVAGQKSIEERAEEYRLARERIFGKEPEVPRKNSPKGEFAFVPTQVKRSPANSRETSRAGTPRNAASSYTPVHRPSDATPQRPQDGKGVIRQPKGPSEGGGFGAR